LGSYLQHRRAPRARAWQAPESEGNLSDFAALSGSRLLALREGGLGLIEGGAFHALGTPQGMLRLFPDAAGNGVWIAGTYHRVLTWTAAEGLHHALSVAGAVREVQSHGDRLFVASEGSSAGAGQVEVFRRSPGGIFEPEGIGISVGMDRWSGFDLSPDGQRIVANLPDGRRVGVWATRDGQLLASWPVERLARILCFVDADGVVFERGPALRGQQVAYADPRNQLVWAQVGGSGEPRVITEDFATVLGFVRWPSRTRLAFADMEGLVRIVELGAGLRLAATLAPRSRGIPWRLRAEGKGLWVLLKGEEVRVEYFDAE